MQAELGLKGVTDGEFRRGSWHMDFLYQIGGVEKTDRRLNIAFKNEAGTVEFSPAAHRVAGKLRLDKTIFGEDFAFLKSVAPAGHDAETDDPVAVDAALPRRPGGDRRGRLSRAWRSSGTTSPRSTASRSPGLQRSAAPICSSTTPASPI